MHTKEEAREHIKKLTESFEEKLDFINSSAYKEVQIQYEFIIPLFKYLNWDTSNTGAIRISDREFIFDNVIPNSRSSISKKRIDILLQLDSKKKMFIEVKHPSCNLKEELKYIQQTYSYAYSGKINFALLTNFKEFRLFNFISKVADNGELNQYCILDWSYKDFIVNFEKLWKYFEKENVRNGSLSKFYISKKDNRISVEEAFFDDLNRWRIDVAKDIKKYNSDFSGELITEAVQLILDRFLFMKVLADREIEEDYIQKIVNKIQENKDQQEIILYNECQEIYIELDKIYNGSIFSKKPELDSITMSKRTLLAILQNFLPDNSAYNLEILPIAVLSNVYDKFLGNVIRATLGNRIVIESTPEVRKAGGVYYNPEYIVNYIVEKTVGERLKKCNTFEDLLKIKICDPACGSGIFLIAVYDVLIQWTINHYRTKKLTSEEQRLVYIDSNGDLRLTVKIKREILLSCIYGVDINVQAVEVTKRMLSLKILENITHDEIYQEIEIFSTSIFPYLEENIKCGNSLLEKNYLDSNSFLNPEELKKLNIFNWEKEFQAIFKDKGGFDCVIGNPPNVSLQLSQNNIKEYYVKTYKTFSRTGDTCYLFFERGFSLLNKQGVLCYYSHSNWSQAYSGEQIRQFLVEIANPYLFVYIDAKSKGDLDSNILLMSRKINHSESSFVESCRVESDLKEDDFDSYIKKNQVKIKINSEPWVIKNSKQMKIKEVFEKAGTKIGDFYQITPGNGLGLAEAFLIDTRTKEEMISKDSRYAEVIKPFLKGKDIQKWLPGISNSWLILLPPSISETELKNNYSMLYEHLLKYKTKLSQIKDDRHDWYAVPRRSSRYYNILEEPKLIFRKIQYLICFDQRGYYLGDNNSIFITGENLKYLLALLNSRITKFMIENFYTDDSVFSKIKIVQLQEMPLILISKERQMPFTILVDWILFAKENKMEKELSTIESALDAMVADLYFEEELKRAGCYILDKLSTILKPIQENDSLDSKKEYLTSLYKFFLQDKVIYNSLIHRRTIDSIKILYGDKNDR